MKRNSPQQRTQQEKPEQQAATEDKTIQAPTKQPEPKEATKVAEATPEPKEVVKAPEETSEPKEATPTATPAPTTLPQSRPEAKQETQPTTGTEPIKTELEKDQQNDQSEQKVTNGNGPKPYVKPTKKTRKQMLKNIEERGSIPNQARDAYVLKDEKEVKEEKKEEDKKAEAQSIDNGSEPSPLTEPEVEEDSDEDWESKDAEEIMQAAKSAPKILYPPNSGLWRPDNPTGKKMYDRDFLMQFQPICSHAPEGWDSDLIKEITDEKDSSFRGGGRGRLPGVSGGFKIKESGGVDQWRNKKVGEGKPGDSAGMGMKGSRGGLAIRGKKSPDRNVRIQRREAMPPPTEGRWERPTNTNEETEVYRRTVRNLLNKLTVDMFPKLSEKLKEQFSKVDFVKPNTNSLLILDRIFGVSDDRYRLDI